MPLYLFYLIITVGMVIAVLAMAYLDSVVMQ